MITPSLVPKTISITPEMAEGWLHQQCGGQRNLRDHHARLLAAEMQHGSFVPHNAITFAVVGEERYLIDGQHRLKAVIFHSKPVSMPVLDIPARDMEDVRRLYVSIDQGLKRSSTDAIRAMGIAEEFGLPERRVQRMSGAIRVIATRFTDTTASSRRSEIARTRTVTRSNAVNMTLLRAWSAEIHNYYEIVDGGEASIIALFDRAAVLGCALLTIRGHCHQRAPPRSMRRPRRVGVAALQARQNHGAVRGHRFLSSAAASRLLDTLDGRL